jgi:DNA-binding CsgD family transcriptional regulator
MEVLTERQNEVVGLMARGFTNQEVGERLGVSTLTVKQHVQSAMLRTHSRNRTHLVAKWVSLDVLYNLGFTPLAVDSLGDVRESRR